MILSKFGNFSCHKTLKNYFWKILKNTNLTKIETKIEIQIFKLLFLLFKFLYYVFSYLFIVTLNNIFITHIYHTNIFITQKNMFSNIFI